MQEFFFNHWRGLLETVLLLPMIYGMWRMLRSTRAARVVILSVVVLVALHHFATELNLSVLELVIRTGSMAFVLALVVVFQPELRRSLANFGHYKLFNINRYEPGTLDILVDSAQLLARKRHGALIALERRIELDDCADTGVLLDAIVTKELIASIFHPRAALHDGGLILDEDRIRAAGCVFPITQREVDRTLGLRHRAAIGMTETSDCICVVVSEETGQISLALAGALTRGIEPEALREELKALLLERDKQEKEKDKAKAAEEGEEV